MVYINLKYIQRMLNYKNKLKSKINALNNKYKHLRKNCVQGILILIHYLDSLLRN